MNVELKFLDKAIKKILKKIVVTLTSTSVSDEIGTQVVNDIKLKMNTGSMPDGKGGLKRTPALTKKTKAYYRSLGNSDAPLFNFSSYLRRSLHHKRTGNTISIESNNSEDRKKLKWLKNSKKVNGEKKKERLVMGWTKRRNKMVKTIITNALRSKLK